MQCSKTDDFMQLLKKGVSYIMTLYLVIEGHQKCPKFNEKHKTFVKSEPVAWTWLSGYKYLSQSLMVFSMFDPVQMSENSRMDVDHRYAKVGGGLPYYM